MNTNKNNGRRGGRPRGAVEHPSRVVVQFHQTYHCLPANESVIFLELPQMRSNTLQCGEHHAAQLFPPLNLPLHGLDGPNKQLIRLPAKQG